MRCLRPSPGRPQVRHSPREWRQLLTDDQYRVLRQAATEKRFSSPLVEVRTRAYLDWSRTGRPGDSWSLWPWQPAVLLPSTGSAEGSAEAAGIPAHSLNRSSPKEHRRGTFACAGCGAPLFASEAKYESGTGWPSFSDALPGAVALTRDDSIPFMPRTEARVT